MRRYSRSRVGVGADVHALGDRRDAGRPGASAAVDLDQAQPAGADVGEAVEVAQRRDRDAGLPRRCEDGLAVGALTSLSLIVRVMTAMSIIRLSEGVSGSSSARPSATCRRPLPTPADAACSSASYSCRK